MFEQKELDFLELEEDEFDTVLATDITFNGKISFEKPFMIKGNISGNIVATSDLVIDSTAVVKADIEAERVSVKGKVEGNIVAKKNCICLFHWFCKRRYYCKTCCTRTRKYFYWKMFHGGIKPNINLR